jgi:hypothetical protein
MAIKGFVKDRFGVEMSNDHASVCKKQILKEAARGKAAAATASKPPAASKEAPSGGISKQEAVRQALADLGRDATPTQMQGHIKEKFGIEMTTNHISTAKGQILRKKPRKTAPKPLVQQAAASTSEPPPQTEPAPQAHAASAAISLADIEAVKDLVDRVGAPSLKKLIDVIAR